MANMKNQVDAMLKNNFMTLPVETPVEKEKPAAVAAPVEKEKPVEKKKSTKGQITTTSVRLPEDIKRALDLYRIDERAKRGKSVSIGDVIEEALKSYIPKQIF